MAATGSCDALLPRRPYRLAGIRGVSEREVCVLGSEVTHCFEPRFTYTVNEARDFIKRKVLTYICLFYEGRAKHVIRSTCDRCLDCKPARQATCLLPLVLSVNSVRRSPLIKLHRAVCNCSVNAEAYVSFPVIKSETRWSLLYATVCRKMLPTISVASRTVSYPVMQT